MEYEYKLYLFSTENKNENEKITEWVLQKEKYILLLFKEITK